MNRPPEDPVDPSEVDATLKTPDPRSPLWGRIGADPHPGAGPYGVHGAAAFREERGYWPPDTPMRAAEDRDRRDRDEPPTTFHRASITDVINTTLTLLRQEMLTVGISDEMLLMASMGEIGPQRIAREMSYQLRAFVLRENLPPVTVKEAKTVPVSILQVSPATWRDHWKLTYGHRWWCRWWVARRPARVVDRPQSRYVRITAEFDLEKYRLYPFAPRGVVSRLGEPVQFVTAPPVRFVWSSE